MLTKLFSSLLRYTIKNSVESRTENRMSYGRPAIPPSQEVHMGIRFHQEEIEDIVQIQESARYSTTHNVPDALSRPQQGHSNSSDNHRHSSNSSINSNTVAGVTTTTAATTTTTPVSATVATRISTTITTRIRTGTGSRAAAAAAGWIGSATGATRSSSSAVCAAPAKSLKRRNRHT